MSLFLKYPNQTKPIAFTLIDSTCKELTPTGLPLGFDPIKDYDGKFDFVFNKMIDEDTVFFSGHGSDHKGYFSVMHLEKDE